MTRAEIRKLTPEQLMAEVAKRVKPIRSDLLGTKEPPNTERFMSNGLVWITGKTYYSETNDSAKVFPWLRNHI